MSLAERLKTVRKCYNLTQKQFAEKVLVNQSYISGIESGKEKPSEILLKLISLEFNVSYIWLKNGTGKMEIEENDYDYFERKKENQANNIPGLRDSYYTLESRIDKITSSDYLNVKEIFDNLKSIIDNPAITTSQRTLILENICTIFIQTCETLDKYNELKNTETNSQYELLNWITKQYIMQSEDNYYMCLNSILNIK